MLHSNKCSTTYDFWSTQSIASFHINTVYVKFDTRRNFTVIYWNFASSRRYMHSSTSIFFRDEVQIFHPNKCSTTYNFWRTQKVSSFHILRVYLKFDTRRKFTIIYWNLAWYLFDIHVLYSRSIFTYSHREHKTYKNNCYITVDLWNTQKVWPPIA